MARTGESYTAARAMLLRAEEPKASTELQLATSDEKIRQRTGRGWEEWFALLDECGAADRSHREIARWLAEQQGAHPLATVTIALVPGREDAPTGVQTGIRLKTGDAQGVHARLQEHGVDVGEVLRWPGAPPMFAFRDQDGNSLAIVEAA